MLCLLKTAVTVLTAASVVAPTADSALTIRNTIQPIMNGLEFADPSIIRTPAGWTGFATNHAFNGKMINVLVATTPDYETWTHDSEKFGTDAMPHLPEWVDPSSSRVWAPDVQQLPDGSFILYYTAALKEDPAHHCVSWAISLNVSGP